MYNLSVLFPVVGLCMSFVSGLNLRHIPVVATGLRPHRSVAVATTEPTAAPTDEELRRRQATTQVTLRTVLEAPDNTCGYFGGDSAQPWGCTAGENCVFATATIVRQTNGTNSTQTSTSALAAGSVLCCDAKSGCPAQPAPTACVDRGKYDYNTTCTGNCPHDPLTLKCTSGIYLFCNTATFSALAVSAFFCNYISNYDALPVETTYTGQENHAFTPTVVHFASTTKPAFSTSSSVAAKTGSSAKVSATAKAAMSGPAQPVNKKSIIGGVVGGVLGLALLVGLVLVFLRCKAGKEDKKEAEKKEQLKAVQGSLKSSTKSEKKKSVSFTESPLKKRNSQEAAPVVVKQVEQPAGPPVENVQVKAVGSA